MKKIVLLLTAWLMLIGTIGFAEEEPDQYPNPVRDMMATMGRITSVDGNQVTIKGDGNYPEIIAKVQDNTYVLNGHTGAKMSVGDLWVGRKVTAYYSSAVTRSYPGKANAFAFVLGGTDDEVGKFFRVVSVTPSPDADEAVVVLNSNHDIRATISKSACADYASIQNGDSLMLWYSYMTMSIPAQTNASRALIVNR